ncbi:DUF2934 domain-containing protein [Nitrosomonas sp.]|uniref:DUF2934 domain-containing protein n=1 Tax=Nitrosomonas sp. TaxID=42353 RepID=UPI0025E22113|nr:DUF2934 domain-containing protein [Nitrosomonas sp.]MBY0483516.1 DUF2934 domain-containing protein [Nitrosomonas sp.]
MIATIAYYRAEKLGLAGNEADAVQDWLEAEIKIETNYPKQLKQSITLINHKHINLIANTARTIWLQAVQPVLRYPVLQINVLHQVRTLILSRISSKQKPLFQN